MFMLICVNSIFVGCTKTDNQNQTEQAIFKDWVEVATIEYCTSPTVKTSSSSYITFYFGETESFNNEADFVNKTNEAAVTSTGDSSMCSVSDYGNKEGAIFFANSQLGKYKYLSYQTSPNQIGYRKSITMYSMCVYSVRIFDNHYIEIKKITTNSSSDEETVEIFGVYGNYYRIYFF